MNPAIILISVLCVYSAYADVVTYTTCDGVKNCDVSQVRVTPCPEAAEGKPCIMKKGKTVDIEFDFVGKEGENDLKTEAYWATPLADLPLVGMDTKACSYITCPVTGQKQTFKYDLLMGKKFPPRSYDVKWKLWKPDGDMECCFVIKIKLTK